MMISRPIGNVATVNGFLSNFIIVSSNKLGRVVELQALGLTNRR